MSPVAMHLWNVQSGVFQLSLARIRIHKYVGFWYIMCSLINPNLVVADLKESALYCWDGDEGHLVSVCAISLPWTLKATVTQYHTWQHVMLAAS